MTPSAPVKSSNRSASGSVGVAGASSVAGSRSESAGSEGSSVPSESTVQLADGGSLVDVAVPVAGADAEGVIAVGNLDVEDRRPARAPVERVDTALERRAPLTGAESELGVVRVGRLVRAPRDPGLRSAGIGDDPELHRPARDPPHPQRAMARAPVADDPSRAAIAVGPANGHAEHAAAHHAASALAADPAADLAVADERGAQDAPRVDAVDAERDGLRGRLRRLEEDSALFAGRGRGGGDDRQQRDRRRQPKYASVSLSAHELWNRQRSHRAPVRVRTRGRLYEGPASEAAREQDQCPLFRGCARFGS